MKVTYNWLKEYADFDWSPEEVGERLTMLGVEVEGIRKISGEFEGVVVAQILSSEKHPNADKLSVCRVADGKGERQIVCGAKNYKPGDKVPLALPGTTLPTPPGTPPFTIKVGKIRGVESHGMMCSPKELGLSEDAEGLMILPPDAQVGRPFAEHLGRPAGDVVFDLEITPNRPDLTGVIGIARELSAIADRPLRLPALDPEPAASGQDQPWLALRVEAPDLCPRYVARLIRGVRIGPSPRWLATLLENVGVRSINNVVDVTNYVMLETGQPLHAFDYHLLKAAPGAAHPVIVVRNARSGEKFTTLDGQERTLTAEMLLIADETKPVALAGIMGGQNSEINDTTVDVLLESAYFQPQNIRATSKKLDLRTESSYRFERGADIGITDWASRRAAQLIVSLAGGTLVPGAQESYPAPKQPMEITFRHAKAGKLLGVEITPDENLRTFRRLGLEVVAETDGESCKVRVPTFRVDLKREIDLIEEITRVVGVDRIPAAPPRGALGSHPFDRIHDHLLEARRLLVGLGLSEAQGQTLISEASARTAGDEPVLLQNALSSDMNALRPSLLPGLIDALSRNVHHKTLDVALFEIGRVFNQAKSGPREQRRVAAALTGRRYPRFWSGADRDAKVDIYDLKGVLEVFLERFGIGGVTYVPRTGPTTLYLESAVLLIGKQEVGEIGQMLPTLARNYDLRDPVFLAELNLDELLPRRVTSKSFKPLPAFPAIRRDVAMILPESTPHDRVVGLVKQMRVPNLESVELFDVFRGKNIPEGQKSMAYAFTYRNRERTLTDAEVNAAHAEVIQRLKTDLQAAIRE